jgi:alkylhydroperoxidase/carboxymuconolactone decarboxylase family protein YurZ
MDIQARVAAAVAVLRPSCGRDAINDVLAAGFEQVLATNGLAVDVRSPAGQYVSALKSGFYAGNPQRLSPEFRECAVLAVLTAQGADVNLALHVFIALASGIAVSDVTDVVLLAGMYAGTNLMTQAMRVVTKTFSALLKAADSRAVGPLKVFEFILAEFPDPALDEARAHLRKLATAG